LINLDFADVRAVMHEAGPTIIGLGRGSGENRAIEAARQAIASPLLEASIEGARGILFNVSGPADLRLREVRVAADEIRASADPDANVIFGASLGRSAGDEVLITLIATGLQWPEGGDPASRAPERKKVKPKIADGTEPATESLDTELPVGVGRKRQPKVASKPEPDAFPSEAHVVNEPPTLSEGHSPDAPTDEGIDLEVPSFLRRKHPPDPGV
jgi:cell division protein FtsZ